VDERSEPWAGRPVVVGYNGRRHSQEALAWAVAEALRRDVLLRVVYAANYPGMTLGPGPGLLDPEPGALEAAQEVTLAGVTEALRDQPDLRIAGSTEVTSPARALVEESTRAGLVVVGTRGFGRMVGALLGSVAFNVAARAECPVVVVKGDPAEPEGAERRVVVGTDGSAAASAAVAFAATRAADAGAALEIISCTGEHPDVELHLRASAATIAEAAADRVRQTHHGLAVTTRMEDSPADRILVDASADAELVVVGTRGRGAFEGLLLGSVSHAVIHGAGCPVAVVGEDQGW
jgi:nucleotide-binding universal stress UspA family protein